MVETAGGKVTGYAYKPDEPASDLVANEVFVFRPAAALDALDEAAAELGEDAVADGALADLGDTLLPRLVDAGGAVEHRLAGYWRDVGTIDAYFAAHQDLLGEQPRLELDAPDWPVRTHDAQRPPARLRPGCEVADSLVAPACVLHGTVERSVLGPGVVVERGRDRPRLGAAGRHGGRVRADRRAGGAGRADPGRRRGPGRPGRRRDHRHPAGHRVADGSEVDPD